MKRNQYRKTYEFFDTEQEAADFCNKRKSAGRKAHYTPWSSIDGKEHKFVAWYYV